MSAIPRLIRRLLFCMRGRHQWGKPFRITIPGGIGLDGAPIPPMYGSPKKQCRNCQAIRAVNTRKRKEAP